MVGGFFYLITILAGAGAVANLIRPQEGQEVGADILLLVDKLKAVNIDSSVFSGPLYSGLVDQSVPLIEEFKGRLNPFATIGSENPISQSASVNNAKKTTTSTKLNNL